MLKVYQLKKDNDVIKTSTDFIALNNEILKLLDSCSGSKIYIEAKE